MMKREPIEIRVVLFGEFSLSRGERVLAEKDYRSQKMWTVLAYLILNRHRPVPQTELIEQFWDEEDGQNPTSALKTLIFRLRKLLLPLWNDEECQPIVSSWGAYQWNPEISCKVDADEFESLLRACEGEETPVSLQLENYRKAMGLYQGEFLPKNTQSTWHTMRSAYYHMQYNQAAYRFALETQIYAMEQLRKALKNSLRQGDVVSQYSGRQFAVMLPSANYENSLMVCERIEKAFYQKCRRQIAQLRYTVRALELFNSEGVAL
ncbi:MAG: winged helix-turn-helix domain-containing protein [Eubacteriales bacterium]|nr:winged helix-turn-helix domain-containing protein [Eubacteriales bacterium]